MGSPQASGRRLRFLVARGHSPSRPWPQCRPGGQVALGVPVGRQEVTLSCGRWDHHSNFLQGWMPTAPGAPPHPTPPHPIHSHSPQGLEAQPGLWPRDGLADPADLRGPQGSGAMSPAPHPSQPGRASASRLTTEPGRPLRPSGPGFPAGPAGPTGPVFPGAPTAPGSP